MPQGSPMYDEYWRFERLNMNNASGALKSFVGPAMGIQQFKWACRQEFEKRLPLMAQLRVTHEKMVDALYSIEMGRLCYYLDGRLKQKDLLRFVKDRKLVPVRNTRPALALALNEADESPDFSKFSELCPELREMIYEEYVADLVTGDRLLFDPSHPPLARTSRQYQTEVLPIFYKRCRIQLCYRWNHEHLKCLTGWTNQTSRYLLANPSLDGQIRKVMLEVKVKVTDSTGAVHYLELEHIGGRLVARFGDDPSEIRAGRCKTVDAILENHGEMKHDLSVTHSRGFFLRDIEQLLKGITFIP